jgi:hypothetical protein
MSLYDQAVDLQLKLDAAQSADSGLELVTKADHVVEALDTATEYLAGISRLQSHLSLTERPPIDAKASAQAITAFRAGLSRYGPRAFQQQPAAKLIDIAKEQRARTARWALARWKAIFGQYQPLMDQAQPGQLLGASQHRFIAERKARKLTMLARQDPVADESTVIAELCDGDADASWPQCVNVLGEELAAALQSLQDEHTALTTEVQKALDAATTEAGLSLGEVTASLLDALRAAGVDDDLVVRRR